MALAQWKGQCPAAKTPSTVDVYCFFKFPAFVSQHRATYILLRFAARNFVKHNLQPILWLAVNSKPNSDTAELIIGKQTLQRTRHRIKKRYLKRFWGDNIEKISEDGLDILSGYSWFVIFGEESDQGPPCMLLPSPSVFIHYNNSEDSSEQTHNLYARRKNG